MLDSRSLWAFCNIRILCGVGDKQKSFGATKAVVDTTRSAESELEFEPNRSSYFMVFEVEPIRSSYSMAFVLFSSCFSNYYIYAYMPINGMTHFFRGNI